MKKEHATTQNRLCIARKALKEIAKYRSEQYEYERELLSTLDAILRERENYPV